MTNKERDPLGGITGEDTHDPLGGCANEDTRDPLGGLANEDTRDPLGGLANKDTRDPLDGLADEDGRDPLGGITEEDASDPLGGLALGDTRDPLGGLANKDTRDPLDSLADEDGRGEIAEEDTRDPLGDFVNNNARDPLGDGGAQQTDESIGYRKPPRQHTWKPGQSGNPRGSRRETDEDRNLYDVVNDLLGGQNKLKNGKTLSGEDLIAEQIMTAVSNGDPRAFREFIRLCRRAKFFERLAPGPRLPEGMRPTDFLKGEVEKLRRKLEKFDRRPTKK